MGNGGKIWPQQLTLEGANNEVKGPTVRKRHAKTAPQVEVPVCPQDSGANFSSQKRLRLDKGQTVTHMNRQTQSVSIAKIDKLNAKQGGLEQGQLCISFTSVKKKFKGANTNNQPYTPPQFGPNTLDEENIEPGISFSGGDTGRMGSEISLGYEDSK